MSWDMFHPYDPCLSLREDATETAAPAEQTVDDTAAPYDADGGAAALPWTSRERYRILGVVGCGGFGRILRARDEVLGRELAIKELIKRDRASEARFVQEIRLTALLSHPGVVPLYDAGRWPNGALFYAMKLIEGRSLKACMALASTAAERLRLLPHLVAVADTLAFSHGEGVVHRDIKPSNILVGSFGETVVIDWGLAATVDALRTAASEPRARERASVGTPHFMAPERVRGAFGDERSDIFALGVILRELISPRSAAALREVVDKATHEQPAQRYESAAEFATAVRKLGRVSTGQRPGLLRS